MDRARRLTGPIEINKPNAGRGPAPRPLGVRSGCRSDLETSIQRIDPTQPWKRAKSQSQEYNSVPCSIARAVKWASEVRFPPMPSGPSSSHNTTECRRVGWTIVVQGWSSQDSTTSKASSMWSGSSNRRVAVETRRKVIAPASPEPPSPFPRNSKSLVNHHSAADQTPGDHHAHDFVGALADHH